MSGTTATVEQVVQARLIISSRRSALLPVTLRYRTDDPLAVRMVFPAEYSLDDAGESPGDPGDVGGPGGRHEPDRTGPDPDAGPGVEWVFARRLLAAGLDGPAGPGDVHVRPATERRTAVELRAPEGVALLHFTTPDLRRFLWRSHLAVPEGQEALNLDPDRELAELLG
ncbi:SsgA family sporulation/cell division regulator [Kitasatospora sp. NPDC088346]|uniref:SsgA family sporulation/cell division regulator n=1 Tax=Kitasatospora sp. NPDC088346 TaxID=3364073 RepID=UPI003806E68D